MQQPSKRPAFVTCYSSDYEHSVERLIATRLLVEEADKETGHSVLSNASAGRRSPQRQEFSRRTALGA